MWTLEGIISSKYQRLSSLISKITIFAPLDKKCLVEASPNPDAPPVMAITLSFNFNLNLRYGYEPIT